MVSIDMPYMEDKDT